MWRRASIPKRWAMLLGGLLDVPSLVAKRCEVSENSRIIATVSMALATLAAAPVSLSAIWPACAIKSNGERPCSTGVVMSVTSPQPTRIGVEFSIIAFSRECGRFAFLRNVNRTRYKGRCCQSPPVVAIISPTIKQARERVTEQPAGLPLAKLPLEGLVVLDISTYLAAPAAAVVLGDFGADVIKVEALEGDPNRG